jgi:hypothetical protein
MRGPFCKLSSVVCLPMKVFLIIVAALIVAGSLFADYKWRQWMATRRRDQENDANDPRYR